MKKTSKDKKTVGVEFNDQSIWILLTENLTSHFLRLKICVFSSVKGLWKSLLMSDNKP